ncbi:MAG TPA: dihydrofolate reductase family protein [Candidatus Dormibacteraeota bacterium]|jgi:dihydrofolate reductase|nr:dihydrofolate reductase family protein [Candidatus Dormibacteraeota bacterium]
MQNLSAFITTSLDGYFTDSSGDMSWAHKSDPEWLDFVSGNASQGGMLLFGRVTYELMIKYWPTPMAKQQNPVVAEGMNSTQKVVFSRTLSEATWQNTKLVKSDLPGEVRKLKQQSGNGICILGSGTIITQLAEERLIDDLQVVVSPIILGKGRTPFETARQRLPIKLQKTRSFTNGNVVLYYGPAA